jgi:hypothetical protein
MKLDEIITQKWRSKKNKLMPQGEVNTKIHSGDLDQGQNGQTHMNIIFNVKVKNF